MNEPISTEARIGAVLERLDRVIDRENAEIGKNPDFDVKTSNAHKSRCLYELTLLFRGLGTHDLSPASSSRLQAIRAKLETNRQKLHAHVEAVRAVADLLKDALQTAEADGTYSMEQFSYREFV